MPEKGKATEKAEEKKKNAKEPEEKKPIEQKEKLKEGERVFTIPLKKAFRKSRKRRIPYAVRLVKEFLKRHMKAEDVKLGKHLNEELWKGNKPPRRIRVKVFLDGKIAKAELIGFTFEEFKAEKFEGKGKKEKLLERLGGKALQKQKEEELIKGKPKKEEKLEKEQPKIESKE